MEEEHQIKPIWRTQIFGTLAISLSTLIYGANIGYPTFALPQLRQHGNETSIYIDENQGSWFAAVFQFCGFIFAPIGGKKAKYTQLKSLYSNGILKEV